MPEKLFVAFDLETTGLNVVQDRIITATVTGHPGVDLDVLMNPGIPITAEASAINGFTDEYVQLKGIDYKEGVRALGDALTAAWDMGATVVGHHILGMDLPMLRMQERAVFGQARTRFGKIMDTYAVYKEMFPSVRHRLVDACEKFGIVLDNAHDAHADARASLELAQVLDAMRA